MKILRKEVISCVTVDEVMVVDEYVGVESGDVEVFMQDA